MLDADLGLANLDVVLNLHPKITLHDVFTGKATLDEAILPAPGGFSVLLAGSGLVEYSRLTPQVREQLVEIIDTARAALRPHPARHRRRHLRRRPARDLARRRRARHRHARADLDDRRLRDDQAAGDRSRAGARSALVVNQVSATGEGRTIRNQLQLVVDRFVCPHLERRQRRRRVARAAGRDPDRRVGARRGAAAHGCCSRCCRARRRRWPSSRSRRAWPRWPAAAARRRRRRAPGLSSTISAPWPPSAGARVREGEHLAALHQPRLHLRLQHRLAARRAVALAVDDAHAAQAGARRLAQEGGEALARLRRGAGRAGRSRPAAPRRRGAACERRRCRCRGGETTARRRSRAATRRRTRRRSIRRSAAASSRSRWRATRRRPRPRAAPAARACAAARPRRRWRANRSRSRRSAARALALGRRSPPRRARRCSTQGGADLRQVGELTALVGATALTAGPARRTRRPRPGRRRGGRARARRSGASALFSVCVRNSSARDGSAAPDGWLCARITAAGVAARARA